MGLPLVCDEENGFLVRDGLVGYVTAYLQLLMRCLSTALQRSSFQLLKGFIRETLYPHLLFLLVMEVFTRMIEAASTAGLISGFSVSPANATMSISHLLFADDTIIFCDNDYD